MKPTILVADDHSLVLEGICRILEDEFEIVATVCDGLQLVEEGTRLQPDIVLADISLPRLSGIEALRKLRLTASKSKLILITQHADRTYVQAAFAAGADGYICKQSSSSELIAGLREVLAGKYFVSSSAGGPDRSGIDPHASRTGYAHATLTARQREVLQLIAEGKQAKQIAATLNISPKTVEFHKAALMDCLGLRTTAELTRYAIAHGIVPVC